MNEIAAKLGQVGLPAPLSELAGRDWTYVVPEQVTMELGRQGYR